MLSSDGESLGGGTLRGSINEPMLQHYDDMNHPASYPTLLGVDTGGTFTDFVVLENGELRTHKVLSTPRAPEQAILQGIRDMQLDPRCLSVVHGSTVATNAVLEGKGVSVAYVANRGLSDVLRIGRQARERLYDLNPPPFEPPVERDHCFEVEARLDANGVEVVPLTPLMIDRLLDQLAPAIEGGEVQAVAINLLFAYLDRSDDNHERRLGSAIRKRFPQVFVSLSSDVLPEYGEYERAVATWINASVGPLMGDYLHRLQDSLAPAPLEVMHSAGGTFAVSQASNNAVRLLLSGPAGGLMGARYVAKAAGEERLLTFDMGGTSTDVALIDIEPALTQESRMGRFPIAVPTVDMHTIGAGGGSIARCDEGGVLQVGPQSAGASPGPACYGKGGEQATVTDANVVLGRLPAQASLGGSLKLDKRAATQAVERLAVQLGLGVSETAEGIVRLANEHMARALRVISVSRGVDLERFVLTPFGGAGGLHVCALADLMQLDRAFVPAHGGVLSALGMLASPRQSERSRSIRAPLDECDEHLLQGTFNTLDRELLEASPALTASSRWQLELRYQGQSSALPLAYRGESVAQIAEAFHSAHRDQLGHALSLPVELVTLRVFRQGAAPSWRLPSVAEGELSQALLGDVSVEGCGDVACYRREQLPANAELEGPCVIVGQVATVWVEPQWRVNVDGAANLHLSRMGKIL
ncbi:5-oxoprolinase [gamma proteobacterium HTCC5015]|nr:5-oxoprolinase [gamma proteobacterium HTCC5015]